MNGILSWDFKGYCDDKSAGKVVLSDRTGTQDIYSRKDLPSIIMDKHNNNFFFCTGGLVL